MHKTLKIQIALATLVLFVAGLLPKQWLHHCANHHEISEFSVTKTGPVIKSTCAVCDYIPGITEKPGAAKAILIPLGELLHFQEYQVSVVSIPGERFPNKAPPLSFS